MYVKLDSGFTNGCQASVGLGLSLCVAVQWSQINIETSKGVVLQGSKTT